MDIFCPHCQNHLSIEDEHAGQYLKCPLCSGMFTAPALMSITPASPPPPPVAPPIPSSPSSTEGFRLEPPAQRKENPPAIDVPIPMSPPAPAPAAIPPLSGPGTTAPPPPLPSMPEDDDLDVPLPVGEYRRAFILHFNPNFLSWLGVVCLGIVFVLTFFTWWVEQVLSRDGGPGALHEHSAWGLAFSRRGSGATVLFALYDIFLIFTVILAVVAVLMTKRILVLPEPFKRARPWRSLIVAGFATVTFLFVFFHWLSCTFSSPPTAQAGGQLWWSLSVWYTLAVLLHFLAVVAFLLEFWLDRRHKKNLPLPKIELRW